MVGFAGLWPQWYGIFCNIAWLTNRRNCLTDIPGDEIFDSASYSSFTHFCTDPCSLLFPLHLTLSKICFLLGGDPIAKASSLSQILTAKAVAEDFGVEQCAKNGISLWSKADVTHPERDAHRIMKKQKTKLEIPLGTIECDGHRVPWISPESWLRYLVDKGLWPRLAGCERFDYAGARENWANFWMEYRKINPDFELFHVEGVDFSRTAACLIHGDEGRTLKKGGMLVTSLQSALGRGFDEKRIRANGRNNGQPRKLQVNFAGHSFTTRFVVSTIPKTAYEAEPEVFNDAVDHVARSCNRLFQNGYLDRARNEVFRICILGVKGDAPYLSKVAHFYRSYNTFAKRGEEKGAPKGCCPYCLAGTSLCAAEEIATSTPKWLPTVAVKLPWTRQPAIIKHLMHDRGDPASFFKSDIWHVFHLGFGRSWICSVIQLLLPYLPCSNLEDKWDYLTDHYLQWCRANHKQSHISRISPYLMSYGDATGAMGNWHKGALTTNFAQWLVELLGSEGRDPDGLLLKCREVTFRVNSLFSTLYKAGAFLEQSECAHVAEQGLRFLAVYAELALRMYRANRQFLFPLYPKLHIWHHLILTVKQSGERNGSALNPCVYACQTDEDLIGKASRLSRRVNIRRVASRTLERYLVAAHSAFTKEGWLS